MADVNIDKLHFEFFRVLISSILLDEDENVEQIEHSIVRVPIQPSLQKYAHEWNTWIEHESHVSTVCVPTYLGGQICKIDLSIYQLMQRKERA